MPYEITATRMRPQTFDDLAGQDFVSATLRASIKSGRIAHAYLFSGPRGCGKTSTARILARSLNCEHGPTAEPCGTCDSCLSIARGSSLDVIEIDGASNTSVENVRQIKDEVLFPPNASKYKIYIIDEVHMLSNSAFNALLKTIEEPPPYIVFIFATTELHKVPATIKSRCQQFGFRLIPLEIIRDRLAGVAAGLGVQADDDALLWMAREATGSLRDAYTLFDQVASFSEGRITAAKIRDKLGLVGNERLGALMERCVAGDRTGALSLLDSILAGGVSVEQFAADAVSYARGLLLLSAGIERESLLGAPRSAFPEAVTRALDAPRVERLLAGLFDLYRDMRYSANPRFELELAVSRMASIGEYVPPAELARTVAALKAAIVDGSAPGAAAIGAALAGMPAPVETRQRASARTASPRTAAESPAAAVPAHGATETSEPTAGSAPDASSAGSGESDLDGLRRSVTAALARNRTVLSMCLERSGPWSIEDDRLVIPCANGYDASTMLSDIGLVAKRVAELFGRPLRVEPRATESPAAPPPAAGIDDEGDDDREDDGPVDPVAIVERVFRGRRLPSSRPADPGDAGDTASREP